MLIPMLRQQPFNPRLCLFLMHLSEKCVHTPYMFGRYKGKTCLVFRGTSTWYDILDDAYAFPSPNPEGREGYVHSGFLKSYQRLFSPQAPTPTPLPQVVAGHSLGAAIALLYCNQHASEIEEAYLFACPKVGDSLFSEQVDRRKSKVWLVQNRNDLITRIPVGYRHCGTRIRLDFDEGGMIQNHLLTNYIRALEKKMLLCDGGW